MFLPYADSFLTDLALAAVDNASFARDITDQFLTTVAMESMADYDGDSDFGSLTRLDLDDDLRVVLVLLDLIALRDFDSHNLHCLVSHYADKFAVIGEGGSQKWWADWFVYGTEAEADAEMAQFAERYSEYLGDEDDEPSDDTPNVTEDFDFHNELAAQEEFYADADLFGNDGTCD